MKFTDNLISGALIKRYKRFFVDVKVNNQIITAHCPNSGSMLGLLDKNNKIWISQSNNPKHQKKSFLGVRIFPLNQPVLLSMLKKQLHRA